MSVYYLSTFPFFYPVTISFLQLNKGNGYQCILPSFNRRSVRSSPKKGFEDQLVQPPIPLSFRISGRNYDPMRSFLFCDCQDLVALQSHHHYHILYIVQTGIILGGLEDRIRVHQWVVITEKQMWAQFKETFSNIWTQIQMRPIHGGVGGHLSILVLWWSHCF